MRPVGIDPYRLLGCALIASLSGCGPRASIQPIVPGGRADEGRVAIEAYACGACHVIPGIPDAHGRVGPSLAGLGGQAFIAGVLPNEPANLVRWILDPPGVDSLTAMPNLGVPDQQARDIAEYLYRMR